MFEHQTMPRADHGFYYKFFLFNIESEHVFLVICQWPELPTSIINVLGLWPHLKPLYDIHSYEIIMRHSINIHKILFEIQSRCCIYALHILGKEETGTRESSWKNNSCSANLTVISFDSSKLFVFFHFAFDLEMKLRKFFARNRALHPKGNMQQNFCDENALILPVSGCGRYKSINVHICKLSSKLSELFLEWWHLMAIILKLKESSSFVISVLQGCFSVIAFLA
jgi:hypothetical protein